MAKPEEWNEPENIDNDSFEEVRNLGRCSIVLLIRKALEIRARNEPSRRFHREGPYYVLGPSPGDGHLSLLKVVRFSIISGSTLMQI